MSCRNNLSVADDDYYDDITNLYFSIADLHYIEFQNLFTFKNHSSGLISITENTFEMISLSHSIIKFEGADSIVS